MNKLTALIFGFTSFLLSAHISEIDHLIQQALVAHNVQTILEKSSKEPVEKRDSSHKTTVAEKDGITVIRVDWDAKTAPFFLHQAATKIRLDYFKDAYDLRQYYKVGEERETYDKQLDEAIKKGLKLNLVFNNHTLTQCTYNQTENAEFIRCEYAIPSDFYSHILFAAKQKTEGSK